MEYLSKVRQELHKNLFLYTKFIHCGHKSIHYNQKIRFILRKKNSVEKFLIARRLMYWQVYLHKTVIAAEFLLIKILKRAKYLAQNKEMLFGI